MLKQVVEKIIYFVFTVFIFIVLWKLMAVFWDKFVPWNYKTDLLGLCVVTPLLIALSFILSSLSFKVIKASK
ncbi:hypothetical protein [Falsibacillus albus]|uniref:Inhibitor of the pro-sigma K processing machinery n=1 Tax=Falsibacillus albus TaxID=2478915 RepID=A0A3L7JNJ6_9BACI|nr:hypothetical protein [Falsibacillus albus]RLQ92266.1 hypothetical protein D9X91_19510 [Falsibacillus albus]